MNIPRPMSSSLPLVRWGHALILPSLLFSGCAGIPEVVEEALRGETPHERYVETLERAGLQGSRMTDAWRSGARSGLMHPLPVTLPHQERGYRFPEQAEALGYEFEATRGERLTITLESEAIGPLPQVFIEVYRVRGPDTLPPEEDARTLLVAYNDPTAAQSWQDGLLTLSHTVRVSGRYRVRMHPELLAEFPYTLTLGRGPSLAFPVEGRTTRNILSFFGQERDGGRREHHGVDIFAARGTPVLAAGPGRVRRVQETPIGGKVVWIFDEEVQMSRYYAHLDAQWVEPGQWVEAGDLIGTVGNTGNAITTAPHLHFGLYLRGEGPVDPWPYLFDSGARPRAPAADPDLLGQRMHHEALGAVRVEAMTHTEYRVRILAPASDMEHVAIVPRNSLGEALYPEGVQTNGSPGDRAPRDP